MPNKSNQLREELRARLRARLEVDTQGGLARAAKQLVEMWGAEVLAILEDDTGRSRAPLLVLVAEYAAVLEEPTDVLFARLFPARPVALEVGDDVLTFEIMTLDRLEHECAGHAWDFDAVGRLVRGFRLRHVHGPVVAERLADCWVGAVRLATRIALDRTDASFTVPWLARRVLSLSVGNSARDVPLADGSLYDRDPEHFDEVVGMAIEHWAARSGDVERHDESWSLRMGRQRRFQRRAYGLLFLGCARVRRAVRSRKLMQRLQRWQRRLGLLPIGEEG